MSFYFSAVARDSTGKVKLWDVPTGEEIATLSGHTRAVHSVSFSPDGKTVASSGYDKVVKLWNVLTKEEIATLTGHTDNDGAIVIFGL